AERFFLASDEKARQECVRLMGGQSQEAIGVSIFYREIARYKEAAQILRWVERENHDPFGTPPEFFYTLAWCLRRAGDEAGANQSLLKARGAAGHMDRFPYRFESEAPLAEAVRLDSRSGVSCFTGNGPARRSHSGRPPRRLNRTTSPYAAPWGWRTRPWGSRWRNPCRKWSAPSN